MLDCGIAFLCVKRAIGAYMGQSGTVGGRSIPQVTPDAFLKCARQDEIRSDLVLPAQSQSHVTANWAGGIKETESHIGGQRQVKRVS